MLLRTAMPATSNVPAGNPAPVLMPGVLPGVRVLPHCMVKPSMINALRLHLDDAVGSSPLPDLMAALRWSLEPGEADDDVRRHQLALLPM